MKEKRQDRGDMGRRLREERQRLGLTQAALADAGKVSKASQVSYEAGTTTPDLAYLAGVANVGVDPNWVLVERRTPTIRWNLLGDLLELIEQWAAVRDRPTPLDEKLGLLRVLYGQFSADGQIDLDAVSATFKLAGSGSRA